MSSSIALLTSTYSGDEGSVQYTWIPPAANSLNSLGRVHMMVNLAGTATEADAQIWFDIYGSDLQFKEVNRGKEADSVSLSFQDRDGKPVTIYLVQSLKGKMLSLDLHASEPKLSAMYFSLGSTVENVTGLPVPYYSGSPLFLAGSGYFLNGSWDHHHSGATLINPGQTLYQPLTNKKVNLMRERLYLGVSHQIADIFPPLQNPKSPYMSELAGRTVFDVWTQQNFTQIGQTLRMLGDYGVNNCAVIIHNWQLNGFDNALPEHYPAAANQGGNTALADAIATGKSLNCYVALHENYVDYYPNYPFFSTAAINLRGDGSLETAWFNPTTQIQSYATKPSMFLANAANQSASVHSGLGTSADFIDVNSASYPWFRVDMDAAQPGAGRLSTPLNSSRSLWALERQIHEGPVFGEGLNHWYWSGLLDGVEAQLGAGVPPEGEQTKLFVDFDLRKIHPLQVNHGMGMYDRWLRPGEAITQTKLLDAYRMQEIAYGHAPYVESPLWTNVSRALLEQQLVGPVARRYGIQKVRDILYRVNGKWTDAAEASRAGDWTQVQVHYENGDVITVNAQTSHLSLNTFDIPQYGWLAEGQGLLAYTGLRNGLLGDYSQTKQADNSSTYFANARNQKDLMWSGSVAQVAVSDFQQSGPRTAQATMQWQVLDGTEGLDMVPFIHFVDESGSIAFQSPEVLTIPSGDWTPGEMLPPSSIPINVPNGLPDGTYSMRVGLYAPDTNVRYQVFGGVDDGTMRCILGKLIVSNGGGQMSWLPQSSQMAYDERLNGDGAMVDFNLIRTDGMVSIEGNASSFALRAYPRYRDVKVDLRTSEFPLPAVVTCDSQPVKPVQTTGDGYWQIPLNHAKICEWFRP